MLQVWRYASRTLSSSFESWTVLHTVAINARLFDTSTDKLESSVAISSGGTLSMVFVWFVLRNDTRRRRFKFVSFCRAHASHCGLKNRSRRLEYHLIPPCRYLSETIPIANRQPEHPFCALACRTSHHILPLLLSSTHLSTSQGWGSSKVSQRLVPRRRIKVRTMRYSCSPFACRR